MTTEQWALTIGICLTPVITGIWFIHRAFKYHKPGALLVGFCQTLFLPVILLVLMDSNFKMQADLEKKTGPIKYELVVAGDSLYRKISAP
jgi:hypothetical protein